MTRIGVFCFRRADIDAAKFVAIVDRCGHEIETDLRIRLACSGDAYLRDWIDRYQGTGRRGYREETRDEDRRLLERHALRYFPERLRLTEVTPSTIAGFVGWLCDGREQAKHAHRIKVEQARAAGKREPVPLADDARRDLADSTVRNAIKPLRSAFATARREGLIRHNPVSDVALPHRDEIDEDEHRPRPFPSR
ncbi:MAG TPA: phage integrase SAM-like domain-containing protein, partial [Solirubrobacteraceae bacterium]|nr:phage integrase SAM-like domain-containing protein [Solirubrobacteraceae bacterium]